MAAKPDLDGGDTSVSPARRSIVDTWTEVFADAGGLVRAEAVLARAETADNLRTILFQSAKLVGGVVMLSMALVFLTIAAVVAVAHFIGYLPALLIVSVLCLLGGLILVRNGQSRLSGQNILPERSLGRMSRDLDNIAARAAPLDPLSIAKAEEVHRHEAI